MHLAIFLTLVWMQQEDEHGKMDYQHWPADLELPTAFLVDPKLFENKKQVQVGLCCFLGTSGKVQTQHHIIIPYNSTASHVSFVYNICLVASVVVCVCFVCIL